MTIEVVTDTRQHSSTNRETPRARVGYASLFAATLLAFLLPFGTVSCGTPVTFTGLELATATVHGDDPEVVDGANTGFAPLLAAVAGVASLLGAALALLGRRGVGRAALVGLVALALLPWRVALEWFPPDFTVRAGYVVSSAALTAVVAIRVLLLVRRRRDEGRRIWPSVAGACLLALFVLLTAAVCIDAHQTYEAM